MNAPEFTRPERLDTIGAVERRVTVTATPDEAARLAGRFALVAVAALTGTFGLSREEAGIRVRGQVAATVTQACSITGDPLAVSVDEAVDLLFVAEPTADGADEIELSEDTIDVLFHDGTALELGEIAAETMALALDPFPRGPGADAAIRAAGLTSEGEAGPFGALAALLKPPG